MKKVLVTVEIPKGSKNKYELHNNELILDRVVKIPYPANYGFVPNTLAPDGDALDAFILGPKLPSLVTAEVTPIGFICMIDNGERDDKLITIYSDVPNVGKEIKKITKFLENYKKGVQICYFGPDAEHLIKKSELDYRQG